MTSWAIDAVKALRLVTLDSNPHLQHAECLYWIRKMQARFFAGDYTAAIESSSRAQRLLWTLASALAFEAAEYHLYSALSRAGGCDSVSADDRQQHLETLTLGESALGFRLLKLLTVKTSESPGQST